MIEPPSTQCPCGCGEMERIGEDRVQRVARYTKTRVPLELPVTRQLGDILARRRPWGDAVPEKLRGWVFPAPGSVSGHVEELQRHYEAIGRAGVEAKFWFRNGSPTGSTS